MNKNAVCLSNGLDDESMEKSQAKNKARNLTEEFRRISHLHAKMECLRKRKKNRESFCDKKKPQMTHFGKQGKDIDSNSNTIVRSV